MNTFNPAFVLSNPKNRLCFRSFFIVILLICSVYYVGNASIAKEYRERLVRVGVIDLVQNISSTSCKSQCGPSGSETLPEGIVTKQSNLEMKPLWDSEVDNRLVRVGVIDLVQNISSTSCKSQCRPSGSETLPEGIVTKQSNLEMKPLWDSGVDNRMSKPSLNLLAIPVGIKQKELVDKIVEKFPSNDFAVMLFHYDGLVDGWRNLSWSDRAIHVSAVNQTKWWFAKRFLHPDIVADYSYIFLWDEDLGVENFDPKRYLSIVKEEGLEISQPALDRHKSKVHHQLTARRSGSKVHRRYYKSTGSVVCDEHSTTPPCIGWVEMMAPVFSKKSWPCVWHMIQNDLVHAWGLDRQLGYCAQGDRTRNVGVVDAEYIVHYGLPTLGGSKSNKDSHTENTRTKIRMESYTEMQIFRRRWTEAVEKDKCWLDPYAQKANQTSR